MILSVFDCFMFCHELDLLEVRLRVLFEHVDRFVIMESTRTHRNEIKPLHFELNKERYAFAASKIDHIIYNDKGAANRNGDDLFIEHKQRQHLLNVCHSKLKNDDIMLISDLDEFPSHGGIAHIKSATLNEPLLFKQDLYYYNITCPMNKKWNGTIACNLSHRLPSAKTMRDNRPNMKSIDDGWHFSYFMTNDEIRTKLKSFAHGDSYFSGKYIEDDHINKNIGEKTNFLGKKKGSGESGNLPTYLLDVMKRFPVFMGDGK